MKARDLALWVVPVLCLGCQGLRDQRAAVLDEVRIGEIVGVEPRRAPDGVVRVTWPRSDVAVVVDGVPVTPPAGVTSWAAFSPARGGALVMGDTVVFQDEAGPAMDAAFAHGLEVTALHNHFFFDEPKVYFMHVGGHGDSDSLAAGVRAMWDAIREVRRARPVPAASFLDGGPVPSGALDAGALQGILGHPAAVVGGVVKFTIGRSAAMHGTAFGASMGLSTWAAFTGSDALAVVDGDFAMTRDEVQPVLHALRRAGIHVVALHNHMIGEEPATYFTHFWGRAPATDLARGLASALAAQGEVGARP